MKYKTLTNWLVLLTLTGVLQLLISSCERTEYLEVDVAPQLEITVTDNSGNSIENATVILFDTEEKFTSNSNPIQTLVTGSNGKALFKDLNEDIYYFYVEKGALNNYYEVVTFSEPLEMNQIMTITCIIR